MNYIECSKVMREIEEDCELRKLIINSSFNEAKKKAGKIRNKIERNSRRRKRNKEMRKEDEAKKQYQDLLEGF